MVEDNTPVVDAKTRRPSTRGRLRLDSARERKLAALKTKSRKEQKRKERCSSNSNQEQRVSNPKRNTLQPPPQPKAKFRKRQRFKSWLPTHLFHAKRAHMTPPKEPLWRMTIPLSPSQKSYRPTHRAARERGGMAWDMSYMSTIGLYGYETSIIGLLKSLGIGSSIDTWWTTTALRWLSGTRSWEGWIYCSGENFSNSIAPVQIVWRRERDNKSALAEDGSSTKRRAQRQVLLRVHPSAFLQLWNIMLRLAKLQRPAVSLEDLRFEIGSIELTGPAAVEALVGALWPVGDGEDASIDESPESTWQHLIGLSRPAQLPPGAILGFSISDPRLHHPPKTVDIQTTPNTEAQLLRVLSQWPVDRTQCPPKFFDRQARILASRSLPSQKSVNRRQRLAQKTQYAEALPTDPEIPIIILAQRQGPAGEGSWTVMLPWKCVSPVWYSLMFYPLSTGGHLRFGGLEQKRQLAYEAGLPWFPGDFPTTEAGMTWEHAERMKRKQAWESRPKGRRVEWETIQLGQGRKGEVGRGWACDWEHLCDATPGSDSDSPKWQQIQKARAIRLLKNPSQAFDTSPGLAIVKITMLRQGVASPCARIYRLPTDNLELRQAWVNESNPSVDMKKVPRQALRQRPQPNDPLHERRQYLAAMLLAEPQDKDSRQGGCLVVPNERDLVGFVTTGNFNLADGKGTCVGSILFEKVRNVPEECGLSQDAFAKHRQLCIVRESGQGSCRLARWDLI